ncbi:hypothetical protein EXN22_17760 [Pseudomonas tructae]|uniref:Uncharacterized protein n=1 Tax=Pseudomonas tructae TaxID=2518644 RepID=A0A411MKY8_9PSED|nr:hypothetical protein [Pseudomonas tructae]QBF27440.1 hypothetical protein EXN22_17760 [Pseudomonas tructae]
MEGNKYKYREESNGILHMYTAQESQKRITELFRKNEATRYSASDVVGDSNAVMGTFSALAGVVGANLNGEPASPSGENTVSINFSNTSSFSVYMYRINTSHVDIKPQDTFFALNPGDTGALTLTFKEDLAQFRELEVGFALFNDIEENHYSLTLKGKVPYSFDQRECCFEPTILEVLRYEKNNSCYDKFVMRGEFVRSAQNANTPPVELRLAEIKNTSGDRKFHNIAIAILPFLYRIIVSGKNNQFGASITIMDGEA